MPDWTAFGAVAGLVLFLVLGLARATTATLTGGADETDGRDAGGGTGTLAGTDHAGDDPSGAQLAGSDVPDESSHSSDDATSPFDDEHSASNGAGDAPPEPAASGAEQGPPSATEREPSSATEQESAGTDDRDRTGDGPIGTETGGDGQNRGDPSPGAEAAGASDAEHRSVDSSVHRGRERPADGPEELPSISSLALLGNTVVTHGVLAAVLVGAAAMTDVPTSSFGVVDQPWSTGAPAVLGGVALGLGLSAANVAAAANLDRLGVEYSEALRSALAPDSAGGWLVLLGGVLPLVAIFEELLFRGVLVGAAAAGTGLSPWWFVVPSSVAFAAGHGIQGRGGVLVTGVLGAVLAVAFVLSESLLLVVVAHYVINAVEFLLHEWLGADPRERLSA